MGEWVAAGEGGAARLFCKRNSARHVKSGDQIAVSDTVRYRYSYSCLWVDLYICKRYPTSPVPTPFSCFAPCTSARTMARIKRPARKYTGRKAPTRAILGPKARSSMKPCWTLDLKPVKKRGLGKFLATSPISRRQGRGLQDAALRVLPRIRRKTFPDAIEDLRRCFDSLDLKPVESQATSPISRRQGRGLQYAAPRALPPAENST